MSSFSVGTFFFGGGIDRFHDHQLLADPGLIVRLDLAHGMHGGLTFADEDGRLLIDDDFDALTVQALIDLPKALRDGQARNIELPVSDDRIEVRLTQGTVAFAFSDGTVMKGTLADVLAALDGAAERLARIRTIASGAS